YRRIKIWCCYKCDYYSSSLFSSFLTKRGCLYGNPLALMANGFLQQSRPFDEQNLIFIPFHLILLFIFFFFCYLLYFYILVILVFYFYNFIYFILHYYIHINIYTY